MKEDLNIFEFGRRPVRKHVDTSREGTANLKWRLNFHTQRRSAKPSRRVEMWSKVVYN